MSWHCIPARVHVTHRQLRSRGLRRSSNVSWRSAQLRLRTESRVPGPEALLYYVHRDPALKDASVRLPRSQTTIWKILRSAGCIQQVGRSRTSGGLVHLPRTHEQVSEATLAFLPHYNDERPNQARSCGNHPPRVACAQFPALPAVPEMVDPDRPLVRVHQQTFARTVQADGGVSIDHREYYVGRQMAGQRVTCVVQATSQQFDIWHRDSRIKQLAIKGLHGTPLPFEEYVTGISQEARSEYRRYLQTRARWNQGCLWA